MMRMGFAVLGVMFLAGCQPQYSTLEGESLARLYEAIEDVYVSDAKFRTDYDPADAPYDSVTLTKNFAFVAQNSETQTIANEVLVQGKSIPLSRWESPLRLWITGETEEDRRYLGELSGRVSELTGLSIEPALKAQDANVYILIADAEDRRNMVRMLGSIGRDKDSPMLRAWPDLAEYPCIARVFVEPEKNTIEWSLVFIKQELRGAFRRSCLTEEFVQSLGLFNDGPDIRPSIFNDDAEFIELTRHDEYLLQILYDPRLEPGMTSEEANPIVRKIAAELLGDAET